MLNKNKIYKTKFVSMLLNDFKDQLFIYNKCKNLIRIDHHVKQKMLQFFLISFNIKIVLNFTKTKKNLKY